MNSTGTSKMNQSDAQIVRELAEYAKICGGTVCFGSGYHAGVKSPEIYICARDAPDLAIELTDSILQDSVPVKIKFKYDITGYLQYYSISIGQAEMNPTILATELCPEKTIIPSLLRYAWKVMQSVKPSEPWQDRTWDD